MGLLSKIIKKEASPEVAARIRNSECGQACANAFCKFFVAGDAHFQWLMADSKNRGFSIIVNKYGVKLIWVPVPGHGERTEGLGFGASGYEDLPNKEYVVAFVQYLYDQITDACPGVIIKKIDDDALYIKLADNVKKGW